MEKGQLVPDNVTIDLIKSRLSEEDVKDGIILDGFPRTVVQAEALEEILNEDGKKVEMVINLETPEEELITRVANRRICSNSECKTIYNTVLSPSKVEGICDKCGSKLIQRKDDNEETIRQRLKSYKIETEPLVDYYTNKGIINTKMVSQSINKFAKDIVDEVVEKLKK